MLLIQFCRKRNQKEHKNVYKFPKILYLMGYRVRIQTWKRCLSPLTLVHISIKQDPQEKQTLLNSRRGFPDSQMALVTAVGGAWNREMGGEGASYFQKQPQFRWRWFISIQTCPDSGGTSSGSWALGVAIHHSGFRMQRATCPWGGKGRAQSISQQSSQTFCKRPGKKYFRLCGPYGLCLSCSKRAVSEKADIDTI